MAYKPDSKVNNARANSLRIGVDASKISSQEEIMPPKASGADKGRYDVDPIPSNKQQPSDRPKPYTVK